MAKNDKKTAVTDPLEASKIAEKPMAEAMPASAMDEVTPVLAKPTGLVEPPAPAVKKFRVVQDTTISLNGQFVKLSKDDVVSEASYGPVGMQRIKEANVALTPVEE